MGTSACLEHRLAENPLKIADIKWLFCDSNVRHAPGFPTLQCHTPFDLHRAPVVSK